ncbi:MAG: site-2 protease family protein [Limnochordales bacterium]|nr:site-2 protease family protein [Limnochordales bacterium]
MTALVAFIVVFGAIVFVHELGHFLAAKAVGVRPFEFAIGFGPALWRRHWGETTYYIRLIPLGGYVRLLGMDPLEEEGGDGKESRQNPEEIDHPRSFARKPLWARLFIIAAGPLMNFIFAALLFMVLAATIAVPLTIYRVEPNSPAAEAGLQAGDILLSVAGEPVDEPRDVNRIVNPRPGVPLEVRLKRDGREMTVTVTPRPLHGSKVALLGVQLGGQPRLSGFAALKAGIVQTWYTTLGIITALGRMILRQAPADISGPIGIFQLVGESARQGLPYVVSLAALLNVNLGLINLLPIPILDGGWLAVFVFEAIRRRPLRPEQRGFAQVVGLVLIAMLMLFATYKDIVRLVGL